uniref:Uncharacterized protein n=1 Tax=Myripristis murdjan TaxID=586833 RepID=A0A667Y784_9TELE
VPALWSVCSLQHKTKLVRDTPTYVSTRHAPPSLFLSLSSAVWACLVLTQVGVSCTDASGRVLYQGMFCPVLSGCALY